jgi:hypothetical protein
VLLQTSIMQHRIGTIGTVACKWVRTAMGYRLDGRGLICIYSTASRPAKGPSGFRGTLAYGVKRSGWEADYSLPSNAAVKSGRGISPLPPMFSEVLN